MKMSKKKLAVVLAALLTASVFAGCSNSGKSTAGDVTEVTVWSNNSHSKNVVMKLAEDWNNSVGKEKGIKIVYEVKEGDVGKETELALASGTAADICYVNSPENKAADGLIVAIEDFEGGQELVDKYREDFPYLIGQVNGKTYSLPFSATTRCLLYNKDMFKAAGLVDENGEATPPKTWDEFREYAKIMTNPEKREYGTIFPLKWSTWVVSDILSPGFSSNGVLSGYDITTGQYDFSVYKPMLESIMGVKEDGSCFPGSENLDNDTARARFAEGGIAMKFGFSWDVGVLNDQFPAKCDWGVAEYPLVEEDGVRYKSLMSTNSLYSITQKGVEEKGKEKIFEVYKWLHSDELISALYQNCCDVPVLKSMVEGVTVENPKKGWVEMVDLVDRSIAQPKIMPVDISGKETIQQLILNRVWIGEMTVDEALAQATQTYNEGIEKYREVKPAETEANKQKCIDPDFNPVVE